MQNPTHALPTDAAVSVGRASPPARLTLTEKRVAALKRPASGEVRVYDDEQAGLVLRLRPDSARWYCCRWVRGKQRNLALGAWPAVSVEIARELAAEAMVKLSRGVDPLQEKRDEIVAAKGGKFPLSDVLDHVIKRMETNDRTARHTAERKRVGRALVAAGLKDLANPRACAIAEKWVNDQTCGDLTKHRYGMHVRALGRAALKKYPNLPHDPFRALEVGSATIPAPALFTLSELITLASDAAMTTAWGRLFAFLLYTGARLREGEYARWSRINLDDATFAVLPPSEEQRAAGEAVKRNKGRTVTIQAELVEILRGWKKQAGATDFLFPAACQVITGDTTVEFRAHLTRLGLPVDGRHIHTLRHSHCALAVACGVKDMELRLSVGHGGPEMTKHYANAAMLWRAKLKEWHGTFKLRDPLEAARLSA